jgi:predicted Fe-Mo cluster-binding NifX family protein
LRCIIIYKIAISSDSGRVSPHFGRAPEYTFVTIEDNKIIKKEVLSNPGHAVGSVPKFVHDNGAKYMITDGIGPRAIDFFNQYGIDVIMGVQGSIEEVVEKFLNGKLEKGDSSCTHGGGKGYGLDKESSGECGHDHHHDF